MKSQINLRQVDGIPLNRQEILFCLSYFMSNKKLYKNLSQEELADEIDEKIRAYRNGEIITENDKIKAFYTGRFKK